LSIIIIIVVFVVDVQDWSSMQ